MGLLANASAALSLTIGKEVEDIENASRQKHRGITNTFLPILKTDKKTSL